NQFRAGVTLVLLFLTYQGVREIRHSPPVPEFSFEKVRNLQVLSTDPSLTAHSRTPEFLDPFLTTILEERDVLSLSGIHERIRRQEYDVVITNYENGRLRRYHDQPILSKDVQGLLTSWYRPFCRTSDMLVMVPKDRVPFSLDDASDTLRAECTPSPEEATLLSAIVQKSPKRE